MALPVWGYYMQQVYADSTLQISQGDFEMPKEGISIDLDCDERNNSGPSRGDDFLDF